MEGISMIIIIGAFVYHFMYRNKNPFWKFMASFIFIFLAAAGGISANEPAVFNIGIAVTVVFCLIQGIKYALTHLAKGYDPSKT